MRKQALLLVISAVLFGQQAAAQKRLRVIDRPGDLGGGEFQILGPQPSGFEDFRSMWVRKFQTTASGNIIANKPEGGVWAGGDKEFQMREIVFYRRNLRFKTIALKGISYQFEGRFPAHFNLDSHGEITGEVLRGTLSRLEKGKQIVKATVGFMFQFYSD